MQYFERHRYIAASGGQIHTRVELSSPAVVKLIDAIAPDAIDNNNFQKSEARIREHNRWSIYQERSAQVHDGYVRWVEDSHTAYLTDIQAGPVTRGMALLEWLAKTTRKELYVVGVVADAAQFWDIAEKRGTIAGQTSQDFMSFFGLRK